MTALPRFLVLPVTVYSAWTSSLDEAKSEARDSCAKYGEDMVVISVNFVGLYEKVSPLWTDADPTENIAPFPAAPVEADIKRN